MTTSYITKIILESKITIDYRHRKIHDQLMGILVDDLEENEIEKRWKRREERVWGGLWGRDGYFRDYS